MSERAEKGHGKAQAMKDPFFRFCVETFLEATSVLVPRFGYRKATEGHTRQRPRRCYRQRCGTDLEEAALRTGRHSSFEAEGQITAEPALPALTDSI